MTKVATLENRRFLCLVVLAAMLITMIPISVVVFPRGLLAADNSTISGQFQTNDSTSPPSVNTVGLYTTGDVAATDMDPGVAYWIKVGVTDNETLEHLTSLQVTIYYDATGAHPAAPTTVDNQTCAIITWTPTDNWTLTNMGAGTTWSITNGTTPTLLNQNTGTFVFHFTPGKTAHETKNVIGDWDIYAVATDAGSSTGHNSQTGDQMTWYGEINSVTGSVNFGSVSLGQEVKSSAITATYICNGDYSEQARTVSQWTSGSYNVNLQGSGAPGNGEFTLFGDVAGTNHIAVQLTTSYKDLDATRGITSEGGTTLGSNALWLTLGPSGIHSGTYGGNIYFAIANR